MCPIDAPASHQWRGWQGSKWWAIPVVLLLALCFLAPRLYHGALRHWDEAWYAEVGREMLQQNSWMTPLWNGTPWFHKPPLSFWATALFYDSFGVSELSARLFSFLCAVAIVGILAYRETRRGSPSMAILCAFSLIAIPEFARYGTRGQIDVPVTLWITCQLLSFWRGLENPRWQLLGGVFFGLAIMTKGAAAGLALVVQATYVLVARDGRPFRQWQWWIAPLLGIAIAAPWHIEQYLVHGDAFLDAYGSRHIMQFFTDIYPEVDHAPAPPDYYLDFFVRKAEPWGWMILGLLAWGTIAAALRRNDRSLLFAWSWSFSIPLALSLAWAKWSWYLVPMYPGCALLVCELTRDYAGSRLGRRSVLFAASVMAILSTGEVFWKPGDREYESEIRRIAPIVQDYLPPEGRLITLQVASGRDSIYPTATLFYCERPVQVAVGVGQLESMVEHAGNVVYVLVHHEMLEEIRNAGYRDSAHDAGYAVERVAQLGPVELIRMIPGWLDDQVHQAAWKKTESR